MQRSAFRSSEFPGSPWSSAGRWIDRHPLVTAAILFLFFWGYRSQYYSGDGDQISRMMEGGVWMVHTELLSQAVLRLGYVVLRAWGWDGMRVMNLVSCLAGVISIHLLLAYNTRFIRIDPLWVLGLFFSSGLVLLCNGHTEYYTLFLPTLFYFGLTGWAYLQGRGTIRHAALAFSLAAWMHLGILFAFPALLLLPRLKRDSWSSYRVMGIGLLPLLAVFLVKWFHPIFGINVHGLSPSSNFIPLFLDPTRSWSYTLFSPWHFIDWFYGWVVRSWIFWPVVWWGVYLEGWRSLLVPGRLFLLIFTLSFSIFTFVWHPNLGIHQDWDLFVIEAAPCLMLVLTYLPVILSSSFRRACLAAPVIAALIISFYWIQQEAHFDQRGYGRISITIPESDQINITYNGHHKPVRDVSLREGIYSAKVIFVETRKVYDFTIHVAAGAPLVIPIQEDASEDYRFHPKYSR